MDFGCEKLIQCCHPQTRNGKEVACTISKLPFGTVIFEDVGAEFFRGQVLKPIDRATKYATDGDALNGRIKYRAEDRYVHDLHLLVPM